MSFGFVFGCPPKCSNGLQRSKRPSTQACELRDGDKGRYLGKGVMKAGGGRSIGSRRTGCLGLGEVDLYYRPQCAHHTGFGHVQLCTCASFLTARCARRPVQNVGGEAVESVNTVLNASLKGFDVSKQKEKTRHERNRVTSETASVGHEA